MTQSAQDPLAAFAAQFNAAVEKDRPRLVGVMETLVAEEDFADIADDGDARDRFAQRLAVQIVESLFSRMSLGQQLSLAGQMAKISFNQPDDLADLMREAIQSIFAETTVGRTLTAPLFATSTSVH